MANSTVANKIKLPKEVRDQLENLNSSIETAKHGIETLKKLKMDVSQLESQIKWAEEVRTTLLANFT